MTLKTQARADEQRLREYWGGGRGGTPIDAANSIAALLAALEAAEVDAARYRWLRSPDTDASLVLDKRTGWVPPEEHIPGVGGYWIYEYRASEELDQAIDAAIAAQGAKND